MILSRRTFLKGSAAVVAIAVLGPPIAAIPEGKSFLYHRSAFGIGGAQDLGISLEEFSHRYVDPAMVSLAKQMEKDFYSSARKA